MAYLLDTDTCIYIIKKQPVSVKEKFTLLNPDSLCVSSITIAELEYGVAKSIQAERNKKALEEFLTGLTIVDFDIHAAACYGPIRATLEKQGNLIGSMDMMIAAIAKSLALVLVTNNTREFNRIDNLKTENWILPA